MRRTFEVRDRLLVDLRVTAGDVLVEPAPDGHAEVELSPTGPAGRELLDRAEVVLGDLGRAGGAPAAIADLQRLLVRVPREGLLRGLGPFTSGLRGGVQVVVRCPEGSLLDARTGAADVRVTVALDTVDVATAHGGLVLDRVHGRACLRTASGEVRVGHVGGELLVDTGAGSIDVGRVDGPVRARTVSGRVRLGAAGTDVRITAASGDVHLDRLDRGTVEVVATAGDVDLAVMPDRSLALDVSSVLGRIRSELEATRTAPDGTAGTPDLALRVRTTTGDVVLRRTVPTPAAG